MPKVLLLMGFGATLHVWAPNLADLLAGTTGGSGMPMSVALMDNRGVGRSSAPRSLRDYSTDIMAADALAVMDHLCWQRFHVIGHSMGAMIAAKLAAAAPQRVASLALLSATGGGWQAVPHTPRALWLGIRLLVGGEDARARAAIRLHFSPSLLAERDAETGELREDALLREYTTAAAEQEGAVIAADATAPSSVSTALNSGAGSNGTPSVVTSSPYNQQQKQQFGHPSQQQQPAHAARGQLKAVFRHRLRRREVAAIRAARFPVLVIHGADDCVALPRYGRQLAAKLGAPYLQMAGAHFVMREQAAAVNTLLKSTILDPGSWVNVERYPWKPFAHWLALVRHRSSKRLALQERTESEQQQAAVEDIVSV